MSEAFVPRNSVPEQEQPIYKIFPQKQEFGSGHIFSPVKDHDCRDQDYTSNSSGYPLWQYHGRAVDMQIFRSGDKYHPVEQHIVDKRADVHEALMVEIGRPQAALILEMKPGAKHRDKKHQEEFLERIWPVVVEANLSCPAYVFIKRYKVF